ncbi:MAG: DUF262 domain-containing protein [Oscillospiraceae bacterium]|nr:DUF262 domain-containing protein [Oscillospiraceae bacterium]
MAKQPIINGKVVERSYEDYRNSLYLVNRRYQRKLVWDLSEKRAFIDSLANGYPVPLFLFSTTNYKDAVRNEIIDGMQRLNAIYSFIENEYCLDNGCYFDLTTTAQTKRLLDEGILIQHEPVLGRDICVKIVSYELPYSIYDENDPVVIDEVFRRINSNGKHLSRQEIRQAGATSEFAQLVRLLSTEIRGDVSHDDSLLLSQMKEISINQNISDTGINADTVFWVKENIINKEDLRQSLDEEQVADMLAAMVLNPMPPSNVSVLDEYYGFKSTDSEAREKRIEDAILAINPEKLKNQFLYVLDEIKKTFYNKPKTIIGQMISGQRYRAPRYFQILFLAMYDQLIRNEKKITDYNQLYVLLENIGNRTINIAGGGGWWTSKEKSELVTATSAVISSCFINRTDGDPMLYTYASEVETLLKQSRTENSQYDFKQGIYNITTGKRNDELIKKIYKTLSAMANTGKNAVGYVMIGVADNLEDAQKINHRYNTDYIKVGSFYITGIDGEVNEFYNGNYEAYFNVIKNTLENTAMPEHYRRQIGAKMRMPNYHDRSVIILRIECDAGAVMFDNNYFTRIGPNNDPTPVSPESMPSFFAKFS